MKGKVERVANPMEGGTHSESMHSDIVAMTARARTFYIKCTLTNVALGFRFHLGSSGRSGMDQATVAERPREKRLGDS